MQWYWDEPGWTIMNVGPINYTERLLVEFGSRLTEEGIQELGARLHPMLRFVFFDTIARRAQSREEHDRYKRLGLEALGFRIIYHV
jgi:hypothetical protein